MPVVRLIRDPPLPPAWNLAFDEALLHGDATTLRFYAWDPPALSLGYFQDLSALPPLGAAAPGLEVVRRPTGGGAIAHVRELTFSVTDRVGNVFFPADVRASYQRLHQAFARALQRLGVECGPREEQVLRSDSTQAAWLCFYRSSALDLAARGRKLLGSAQRRVRERVLHHGSLPLAANPCTPQAISVEELRGRSTPREEVEAALIEEIAQAFGVVLEPALPSHEERERAAELVAQKYGRPEWTERRPRKHPAR